MRRTGGGSDRFDIEKSKLIRDFTELRERHRQRCGPRGTRPERRRPNRECHGGRRREDRRNERHEKAAKLRDIILRQCGKRGKESTQRLVSRTLQRQSLIDCLGSLSSAEQSAFNMDLRQSVGMHDAGKLRKEIAESARRRKREEAARRVIESANPRDGRPCVANHEVKIGVDASGDPAEFIIAMEPSEIRDSLRAVNPDFPKRIGEQLFVDDEHGVRFLTKSDQLFAWLYDEVGKCVRWRRGMSSEGERLMTEDELLQTLTTWSEEVRAIEEHPLWPEPEQIYLTERARRELPELKALGSEGRRKGRFEELVTSFEPRDEASLALIEALVLTLVWGGAPGGRPLFLVTGPRGSGKSTLVRMIARLVGGCAQVDLGHGSQGEALGEQILADTNLTRRVVLLDNAEGYLRSPDLAQSITNEEIEARPKFAKRRRRINLLTYVATVVDPSLDSDLAARCVVISLRETSYSPKWQDEMEAFIDKHRDEIIAEAFEKLEGPKQELTGKGTRFPRWDANVLAATSYPQEVLKALGESHQTVNEDLESLARFLECVREKGSLEMRPAQLAECWNEANGTKLNTGWVIRRLKGHRSRGELPDGLRPKWERKNGSSWLVSVDELEVESAE